MSKLIGTAFEGSDLASLSTLSEATFVHLVAKGRFGLVHVDARRTTLGLLLKFRASKRPSASDSMNCMSCRKGAPIPDIRH